MTIVLYNGAYTDTSFKDYRSHISSSVKANFLQYQELYLTLTWSPIYGSVFTDTGSKVRTESVKINWNVDHEQITYYKYFPTDGGIASDWFTNPGTLIAGIIDISGELRIIIDECSGYLDKYYSGSFEPDFLYNIVVSTEPISIPSFPYETLVTTELESNEVMIGNWSGKEANGVEKCPEGGIVIPRQINGRNVVAIAERAFCGCKGHGPLVIFAPVKSIGAEAFANNTRATDLSVYAESDRGSGLSIGARAFEGFGREIEGAEIRVTLPHNTSLQESAFEDSSVINVVMR